MSQHAAACRPSPCSAAGVVKGLLGDSGFWRVMAFALYGGKLLKRAVGKTEKVAATLVMRPGEVLQLETIEPRTKAERKQARKLAS